MDITYSIKGGVKLSGELTISGSKNAALPIMAATLLSSERCFLSGIPILNDTLAMSRLLESIGKTVHWSDEGVEILEERALNPEPPADLVSAMRASICVLGPLLARCGYCKIALPGGCAFGPRPVDLHLHVMSSLGADVSYDGEVVHVRAKSLKGAQFSLLGKYGSTVLGTSHAMMTALYATGTTLIEDAACEPEVQETASILEKMGASIEGVGTGKIKIFCPGKVKGFNYNLVPDRIEASTYLFTGAVRGSDLLVKNAPLEVMGGIFEFLKKVGASFRIYHQENSVRIYSPESPYAAFELDALPYPGFPTDLQPLASVLACTSEGISHIRDRVYPSRFQYVDALSLMGAQIRKYDGGIEVKKSLLHSASVKANDLRAGGALIMAALCADGETIVHGGHHIERGYEMLENKLKSIGAQIKRDINY